MSTIPGLHVIGEANFSDHGANRLGASALMQGLADGYFILPEHDRRLPGRRPSRRRWTVAHPEFRRVEAEVTERTRTLLVDRAGSAPWIRSTGSWAGSCGTSAAWPGTRRASSDALARIPELREEFWRNVNVPGSDAELNQALEKAGRVADFLELGELMCRDALHREESCGGHFREEHQTEDGEARRDDEHFAYVAAWEYTGDVPAPRLHQGAARVRVRAPGPAELQVNRHSPCLAAGRSRRARAAWCATRRSDISPDMSFLEMLDVVNERLMETGEAPIAFDHDCREGICGACSLMINGVAHGPNKGTATCQLHMRSFGDGDEIHVEPWRARAFPGREGPGGGPPALDRIIAAGGYVSAPTGSAVRRQRHADPQGRRGHGDGRGPVHRVRRLRRGLPQRAPPRCSPRPRSPISACCRRASPSGAPARAADGRADGPREDSAAARCTASARKPAPS